MIRKILKKKVVQQFISYFFVGGTAALVEWIVYFICEKIGFHYLIGTIISFLVATFVNWIVGRKLTFSNSEKYKNVFIEIISVYLASAMGLLFNLALMWLFVSIIGIYGMFAKIISTGIVFIWNFLIRKFLIYKD